MPPVIVTLALLAIGIPSALRAVLGRPRFQLVATIASGVAVVVAQVLGELLQFPFGVVGDTQIGLAALASLAACGVLAVVEGAAPPAAQPRRPRG